MKKLVLFFALLLITLSTFAAKVPAKQLAFGLRYNSTVEQYSVMFKYAKSKGYKHFVKADNTPTYVIYYFSK